MRKIIVCLGAFFCVFNSSAQEGITSGDIYLGLKKLNVLQSVLYVAAHPDDENTRLISYLSKDRLLRTGYLSLTRGDGGQNLIGDEQGVELGLIRTQELLSARRIDGGEQFFTRAYDFGYSKTPGETFAKWNREAILSDVVWVIRKFRPDVIITRFPVTGEGGHGHHTASAILANEAFVAAADPKRFPEQLKYVEPWAAKRILWNTFNFSGNNTTSSEQFKMDVGGFSPVLGKSYGEIAAESRSQHKSQGFGVPSSRGEALEHFRTTGGDAPTNDLLDGVASGWSRITADASISNLVNKIIADFDFISPKKSVPQLVELYKKLKALPSSSWKEQKLEETKRLILAASGLYYDAFVSTPRVAQGDSLSINFSINDRAGSGFTLKETKLLSFDSSIARTLSANTNLVFSKKVLVPQNYPLTFPYWLREPMEEGKFNVKDQREIGKPDVEPSMVAVFRFTVLGEDLDVQQPVRFRFTDPVKGEIYQPLYVVPEVGVSALSPVVYLTRDVLKLPLIKYELNSSEKTYGKVVLGGKERLVGEFLLDSGQRIGLGFMYNPTMPEAATIQFQNKNEKTYDQGYHVISYDHIPDILVPVSSRYVVKPVDIKITPRNIGYITGAGDKVPQVLEQVGYKVTLLDEAALAAADLSSFDAIITGVRAYNTNAWMSQYYDKLMSYVSNGGNVIVQYNTSNGIGPVRAKISPFPLNITRTRVTDEKSPVSFVDPSHRALVYPNLINTKDFEGWVQERSIYHGTTTDSSFKQVIRFTDPGETAEGGSLLVGQYGKGYFTYTGIAFFRQLPAGVPGALRLFVNLIELNKSKQF